MNALLGKGWSYKLKDGNYLLVFFYVHRNADRKQSWTAFDGKVFSETELNALYGKMTQATYDSKPYVFGQGDNQYTLFKGARLLKDLDFINICRKLISKAKVFDPDEKLPKQVKEIVLKEASRL